MHNCECGRLWYKHIPVRLIFPEALRTIIQATICLNAMESLRHPVSENEVKSMAPLLFISYSLTVLFATWLNLTTPLPNKGLLSKHVLQALIVLDFMFITVGVSLLQTAHY